MKVCAAISADTLAEVKKQVAKAEIIGFDGVVLPELKLDPFLAATITAEYTDRVRLATGIALAFPRSPMTTAYMAWAIQQHSVGRFELGLGTQVKGHNERRFSVTWDSPGPRLREYINAIRTIWSAWHNKKALNFKGEFYNFSLMAPAFDPGPICHPDIPISISAVNKYNLKLGGEICNGVQLHSFSTYKYDTELALPHIENGTTLADRKLKEVTISGGGFIATAPSDASVKRKINSIRKRISFYGSTRTYKPVMDIHGWGDVTLELHRLSLQGRWDEMEHLITDQMIEAFAIIGKYNDLPDLISKRYGGWASRITLELPEETEQFSSILNAIKDIT